MPGRAKGEREGSWCEVHCGQVCALGCGQGREWLLHLKFGVYRGLSVLHGGQQKMLGGRISRSRDHKNPNSQVLSAGSLPALQVLSPLRRPPMTSLHRRG